MAAGTLGRRPIRVGIRGVTARRAHRRSPPPPPPPLRVGRGSAGRRPATMRGHMFSAQTWACPPPLGMHLGCPVQPCRRCHPANSFVGSQSSRSTASCSHFRSYGMSAATVRTGRATPLGRRTQYDRKTRQDRVTLQPQPLHLRRAFLSWSPQCSRGCLACIKTSRCCIFISFVHAWTHVTR